jgi:hypothetical protein
MARLPLKKKRGRKLKLTAPHTRKPLWGWWDNALLGIVLMLVGLLFLSHYWEKVVASVH